MYRIVICEDYVEFMKGCSDGIGFDASEDDLYNNDDINRMIKFFVHKGMHVLIKPKEDK